MLEVSDKQRQRVFGLLESLRTERDELRVRMYLARAEVRDEWQALEQRWEHFESRVRAAAAAAQSAGAEVGGAVDLLAAELRKGYTRVRQAMRH
ncbi:MAG: hypothetical protein AB7I01_24360 [Gammaproteobacteria bacterium]